MDYIINVADFKDPDDPQGRTYREVNNAMQHKFSVGDLVELDNGVRLFIALQTRDCDGTLLYCLTPKEDDYEQQKTGFANVNWLNGYDEESLKQITNRSTGLTPVS